MKNVVVNNIDITNFVTSFEEYNEMDNGMIIGSAVSTQIKIKLKNKDDQLKELLDYPFIIGDKTYIIYERPEKWTKSISLTLYDQMILSNISYDTKLVYPVTVDEQLDEMSSLIGIPIDKSTLSDNLLNKEVGWYDNTIIIRQYIGFIAQCDGKNAFIENDMIVFKPLAEVKHETSFCGDYELNELITFTRVCYDNGVTAPLYKGNNSGKTLYVNSNNSYIAQEDIDRIYNMYNGLSFYSFRKFKCKDISGIKLTDLVRYHDILILPLSIKKIIYGGEAKNSLEMSADITIKNVDSVIVNDSPLLKIHRIQTIIDQTTASLEITAKQVEDNKEDISNLEISLEGIKTEVSKTINSIYKFESGSGNIYLNCYQMLTKNFEETGIKYINDMPLDINMDFMRNKDICISCDVLVQKGIIGTLGNFLGAEFEVGYADGTKKKYYARWYLGQYNLQYLLQTSTVDHEERIWMHYKIEDKEITSVSNLKMIIAMDCELAIVANPKVEFGTYPTGFEFDMSYIRDNITTIQKDYTEIKQDVSTLTLKSVSMEEEITTIKGDVSSVTTRLQSAEISLQPTNILLAVNESIGAGGELYTTKFMLDKSGAHISGGGIDISNNAGVKVLYADMQGNLVINNLTAVNGNFSGVVNANDGVIGGWNVNENGLDNGTVKIDKSGVTNIYTWGDLAVIQMIIMGSMTGNADLIKHYDFNGDGKVTSLDYMILLNKLKAL